ncbi:hypothetical protein R3P38DRAFT_3577877 [Favolaschia claudopus]|uniref:Uncharacterized protein n=1 Tax=Favolaschia claudopus TaxID=2862362 RepID=A0AAW0DQY9_9AGAR
MTKNSTLLKHTSPRRTRVSTAESREKAKERQAKYRRKPDTRQKESSYLAQRRAAIKASRRRTDSSSKSSNRRPKIESPQRNKKTTSTETGSSTRSKSNLELLADLATQRITEIGTPRPSSSYWDSLSSDSRESSRDAALDLSAASVTEDPHLFVDEPLPRYCSPATSPQRKNWHNLGQVGPLSGVQRAQLITIDLALPQEYDDEEPQVQWDRSGRMGPRVEMMSSERWKWVRAWRHAHEQYEYCRDWENEGRKEVAED